MSFRSKLVCALLLTVACMAGCAELLTELDLDSPADAATPTDGLREALRVGTGRAVEALGRADGYLGNAEVRIPVPDKVESVAKALRTIGAGHVVDEFVTSMNRAAEAAAPLAKTVFVDTVRGMTFTDAVAILRGKNHEATDYLREHAGPRLAELFQPIVANKLESVGATRDFEELVGRAEKLPFVRRPVFDLDGYVTDEALDGLFKMIAREEEKIRKDPVARTTELLRKFFGENARY